MLLSVFLKGIFVVKNKRLNCWISGRIISISGIRPDIENGRIYPVQTYLKLLQLLPSILAMDANEVAKLYEIIRIIIRKR